MLRCLVLAFGFVLLSGCSAAPLNLPDGTYLIELRPVAPESGRAIRLCVPETTIQPISRTLNGGNAITLANLALLRSNDPGSTLQLVTAEELPARILPNGVAHPDDRLSVMLSLVDGPANYVAPAESLDQTTENKVVDLAGEEFDLYRERTWGNVSEVLRPRGGVWRGSRLTISCDIDPRLIQHFSGASTCQWGFRSGDFMYSISTGRAWLERWPEVTTAVEEAIDHYREHCR